MAYVIGTIHIIKHGRRCYTMVFCGNYYYSLLEQLFLGTMGYLLFTFGGSQTITR